MGGKRLLKRLIHADYAQVDFDQGTIAKIRSGKFITLVFGYWSIVGLIYQLMTDTPLVHDKRSRGMQMQPGTHFLQSFGKKLFKSISNNIEQSDIMGQCDFVQTALTGRLFRLFTHENGVEILSNVLQGLTPYVNHDVAAVEDVVTVLRSVIPLPHNEIYQNQPTGKAQWIFMTCTNPGGRLNYNVIDGVRVPVFVQQLGENNVNNPEEIADIPPPYWRFIGKAISTRLMGGRLNSDFFQWQNWI